MNRRYLELIKLIRKNEPERILKYLSRYHENDVSDILENLNGEQRKLIYSVLGDVKAANVFTYFKEPEKYLNELSYENAAKIISHMDSYDAAVILERLEESDRKKIIKLLDSGAANDVTKLLSYDECEIGSRMTTNYVSIKHGISVRRAMSELVRQAGLHDNISTIYVVDEENRFYGAIDLKKLITARQSDNLNDIIICSYPYFYEHEKIGACLDKMVDYSEDSIPVLSDEKTMLGIITSEDMVEIVDDEMSEDYAKLAGLTTEEDLNESTVLSVKKRLPWLMVLLILGMFVSSVVGIFENVVVVMPIVICFQSLVLDMAGNVGTQSLAVTIRVLMDENIDAKQKLSLLVKEMKIGFLNGGLLGIVTFVLLGMYIYLFKGFDRAAAFSVSGCVGVSLVVAMVVSSCVGTTVPMLFKKIKIDPAVASGPLITTVNDLVAVVTYYGLAYLLLIR